MSTQRGDWELDDPIQYLCYAAFAWLAFALRLPAPIAGQTLSMGFVFVVVALNELTLRESMQICGSVILIQAVLPSNRTRKLHGDDSDTVQLLSTLLSTGTAILVSQLVYTAPILTEMRIEVPVRLVLAATACLFANHLPLALIYAITDKDGRRQALQACQFWSYPYYLVAAALAAAFRWPAPTLTWPKTLLILPLTYAIYYSYRLYLERLSRERRHSDQVGNLHLRTIEALSLAIEARDGAPNPVRRVQVYCEQLGKAMRLRDDAIEALRAAALLYDIGKLAVPEHIRSKPGRLTPEEYDKIKIHPGIGADILEHVQFPYPVVPIVRFHHERWDGSGYPEGRKHSEIPVGARILAVADTIDALTSDRPYRAAMPLERAIDHVASLRGIAFDPEVVEIVLNNYLAWEEIIRASQARNPADRGGFNQLRVERGAMPANGFESTGRFLMTINAARQEAQALLELTQRLGNSLDLNDTCSALESGLKPLVPFDTMALYIQRGDVLVPQHVCGDHLSLCASIQSPMGKGLSGWVAAAGKPILNGDPSLEFGLHNPALRPSVFASAISVPLAGSDSFRGALTLYGRMPEAFSTEHLRVLNAIAPKLGPAIENGLKFKVAENSSTTDYLTSLPNAQSLFRHLERELALSRCLETQLAVVVCDLDGFKQVNDRFGHLTGNDVLRALGEGLRDCCRDYDYVARMGGDEFALVFYGMTKANVQGRLEQLRDMVITIGQGICHQAVLDASFGVAFFPSDGQNAEELLAAADRNMYQVKDGQRWERQAGRYENVRMMPRRAG